MLPTDKCMGQVPLNVMSQNNLTFVVKIENNHREGSATQ